MDSGTEPSDEVEGLRLIRAFLSLPPDKRAEVIALVEGLARAQGKSEGGKLEESRPEAGPETSPG